MDAFSVLGLFGRAGIVSGAILGLPQVLRLLRTGPVGGLSSTVRQAMLVVNLSWAAHGLSIGQVPQNQLCLYCNRFALGRRGT